MADDFYDLFARKEQDPHRELANVTPLDPERASRYARKALISECENVAAAPEGTRNHALNRAAFSIGQLVAAGHLREDDARTGLTDAARSAGLPDHEIEGTLRSGLGAGAQTPRIVADLPPVPHPTVLPAQEGGEGVPVLNPVLDWHQLWESEDEEEWIVEPILPARRMVALYSEPKAGKSLLILEVAVAVARGTEILGTVPDRPRRVLYIDFENDPQADIRTRLEAMNIGPDDLDNLQYLSYPQLAKMDNATGADDLIRHVLGYDCEVVIIDTVSRAVAGEENENDTWLAFYRHSGLALKRAGIACIRLDHSGKDKEKGMRGGSAKTGDVDAVWRLTPVGEQTIVLECTHSRMRVDTKHLTLVREDWPLRHVVSGNPLQDVADAKVKELDQTLDNLNVASTASVREATKALRGAGHHASSRAIREAVKLRKVRLDTPLQGVPGTLPAHPSATGPSVPGTPPPLGGVRHRPARVPGTPVPTGPEDPDLLVSCKGCFKPTTKAVYDLNDGLCANCHLATGQETP